MWYRLCGTRGARYACSNESESRGGAPSADSRLEANRLDLLEPKAGPVVPIMVVQEPAATLGRGDLPASPQGTAFYRM